MGQNLAATARAVRGVFALLMVALLTACPRAIITQSRAGEVDELPQDGNLSLSLRAILVDKNEERSISENEPLHSGDFIYFLVRTSQPAYVYLVMFDEAGKADTLFPAPQRGERKIGARCPPLRVPGSGAFYLRLPGGIKDLRAVASPVPLGQANRRQCDELQLPCDTPAKELPPECPSERKRSFFSIVKVASANARGIASLRMTLRHDQ